MESDLALVVAARRFVHATLSEWELEGLVDEAVLVASELVANAVLHARTSMRLSLASDGLGMVRIEVYDDNVRVPIQAACPDEATSGRGLNLVAAVSAAWGTEQRGDGKVVWAEVGRPISVSDQDCLDLTGARTVDEALERIDNSTDPGLEQNSPL